MTRLFDYLYNHVNQLLNAHEKIIHLLVWVIGLIIINVQSFEVTIGLFHSTDYSLLIPSIYGTALNMIVFYGSAHFLVAHLHTKPRIFWTRILFLISLTSLIEGLLDIGYFLLFYGKLNWSIAGEIIRDNFLGHSIFFFLPSLLQGYSWLWRKKSKSEKVCIKSGNESFLLTEQEIYYVESDANYSVYHTKERKILVRSTLSNTLKSLPEKFIRIHKSFIINLNHVDKITNQEVSINDKNLPIGRKYKEALKSSFKN